MSKAANELQAIKDALSITSDADIADIRVRLRARYGERPKVPATVEKLFVEAVAAAERDRLARYLSAAVGADRQQPLPLSPEETRELARKAKLLELSVAEVAPAPTYDLSAWGLGSAGSLEALAGRALEGSATTQTKILQTLRKATKPILDAEARRFAVIPKRESGVVRARIGGVVTRDPSKRGLTVTPPAGAKPPRWWHPKDPWPVSQFHAIEPGMEVVVRAGSPRVDGAAVKAGDVLARVSTQARETCMMIPKPQTKGYEGAARTVTLPEPMAVGYAKQGEYPDAASAEEAVIRYILDEKSKQSGYLLGLGRDGVDLARARLAEGDVQGLFQDLKAGGFKVKTKRRMGKQEAVLYARRIIEFLRGKGAGPEDPALRKWSALLADWSAKPANAQVEVPTSRPLPEIEVDAWRWDGVDWVCLRGAPVPPGFYRKPLQGATRDPGLGPVGLQTAVVEALRDGLSLELMYTNASGENRQELRKPVKLVSRAGELILVVEDSDRGQVSIRASRIQSARIYRPKQQVDYPWAVQVSGDEVDTMLAQSTSTLQSSAKPPQGFGGRVYLWDKDKNGVVGSVEFASASENDKGKWLWLFRSPEPYGFLYRGGSFKRTPGSWPAGRWFIDPEVAADPPDTGAERVAARAAATARMVSDLLQPGALGRESSDTSPEASVIERVENLILQVENRRIPLARIRSLYAELKSALRGPEVNPSRLRRPRKKRLTPRGSRH